MVNLVSNAIKFSDRGKSIKIELSKVQRGPFVEKVSIMVEDEGVGIMQNEVEHIFEKFFASKEPNSVSKNP
jgi:signal transduction histidine kinase